MTDFTGYWTGATCDFYRTIGLENKPLMHAASEQFRKRKVGPGDQLYVLNIEGGALRLIGRMLVKEIVSRDEARSRLGYEPWEGSDHALSTERNSTKTRFDLYVPLAIVRQLEFRTASGLKGLKFRSEGKLDGQTLRSVRELTPESAALLDGLLA